MSTAVIGAPEFRAASGRTVRANEDGSVTFEGVRGYLGPEQVFDAAEFFQAQKDIELGRWRWPENPDYVVYRMGDEVVSLNEQSGATKRETLTFARLPFPSGTILEQAIWAYREAHPDRKPWHDARQYGGRPEVWALTLEGVTGETAFIVDGNRFESGPRSIPLTDPSIIAGRCIWPEPVDAEIVEDES